MSFIVFVPGLPLWAVYFCFLLLGIGVSSYMLTFVIGHQLATEKTKGVANGFVNMFAVGMAPLLQPFERINWFIHGDSQRWHPVEEPLPQTPVATWHIRSERETLCRYSDEHLLFTINTRFQPLAAIVDYPQAQADLRATLMNLDTDEVDYFGGPDKCEMLIGYLESLL